MKRSRFSEEQFIGILREQEAGAATADAKANADSLAQSLPIELRRTDARVERSRASRPL